MLRDAQGHALTGATPEAVQHYDTAVAAYNQAYGDAMGGFNAAINFPGASWTPAALTNLKTESFTYTLDRDMQKAEQRSLRFGESLGFSRAQRSHLVGVSDPTTPWMREARLAQTLTADSVVLFALDQFCLIGYPLPLSRGMRRATFNK